MYARSSHRSVCKKIKHEGKKHNTAKISSPWFVGQWVGAESVLHFGHFLETFLGWEAELLHFADSWVFYNEWVYFSFGLCCTCRLLELFEILGCYWNVVSLVELHLPPARMNFAFNFQTDTQSLADLPLGADLDQGFKTDVCCHRPRRLC